MNIKKQALTVASCLAIAVAISPVYAEDSGDDTSHEEVSRQYGNIDAFWGDINAFWGDIDAFYGDIDAFWGDIDAFYGDIDAFWGDIDAFWGDIDAFWGDIDAFWGDIDAFQTDQASDALILELKRLFIDAEATFGEKYTRNTGLDFNTDLRDDLLDKYGIDLNDPESLEDVSLENRNRFYVEFYDRLMAHSGVDMVDHWMPKIRWSPVISQKARSGAGVTVGLLDTPITSDSLIGGSVKQSGGYGLSAVDHGAGVAGIIAGAHDNKGIMGLAPNSDFLVYNPFDESFTASWDDVKDGIAELSYHSEASIINLSLGVEGYVLHPDWSIVFNSWQSGIGTIDTLLVKSAGNSGATQTQDVDLGFSRAAERLIIVGSVNSAGEISTFSNRPGEACITSFGNCNEQNKLKYRFIVAPGELILVQDNNGSITRANGTSLAAPQVSGAAALLQSRWAWLKDRPAETGDILLQSATDLGETGVDSTYGWGMLNVEASQQPLDAASLYVLQNDTKISLSDSGMSDTLISMASPDGTLIVFEDIGRTYRDFDVPLASLSLSTTSPEQTEATLAEVSLLQSMETSTTTTDTTTQTTTETTSKKGGKGGKGGKKKFSISAFAGSEPNSVQMVGSKYGAWMMSLTAQSNDYSSAPSANMLPFTAGVTLQNQATGARFSIGNGDGSHALAGSGKYLKSTGYGQHNGGANPYLGLATGSSYAMAALPVHETVSISFGYTQNTDTHQYRDTTSSQLMERYENRTDYSAQALTTGVNWNPTQAISIGTTYTHLRERSGLYGGQATGVLNLNGGTTSNAITIDMGADITPTIRLGLSASWAKTYGAANAASILQLSDSGLDSSAFQLALEKQGLLNRNDILRVSVAKPLQVTSGGFTVTSTGVTDRSAGTLGLVQSTIALDSNATRYVSEIMYGRPVMDGAADLSAFGQVQSRGIATTDMVVSGGIQMNIDF